MNSRRLKRRQITAILTMILMALSYTGCSGRAANASKIPDEVRKVGNTIVTETSESSEKPESLNEKSQVKSNETETVSPASDQKSSESLLDKNSEEVYSEIATTEVREEFVDYSEDDNKLTPTMRNSINMLNHMTSMMQRVNVEKGNQLFLESAYDSFDNLYPNSVDTKTQAQITSLLDTIQAYRMISVKRARLEYIYEQNRAQALRQAIPNPIGLLSAVSSGDPLRIAVSVLYMAVDSATSYQSAASQADLQFLKDGWELDDAESSELHNSTKNALNYMYNMVRDYDIVGDYALSKESVEDFVTWSEKPDSQLVRKISWFETNEKTYSEFGPYWLELAKDYYNYGEYKKCLDAVNRYESIYTRIFRKNIDYANILPMAIMAAKETMSRDDYVRVANNYCKLIHDNTKDEDWAIRYFAAQIYMDLYAATKDNSYLISAYKNVRENVVVLVDEQKSLNASYLADIKTAKADKDATKREKKEVKNYNKIIKEERKVALPPVSEALYLNCDLLFALAKEIGIDSIEQREVDAILHEEGNSLFLTEALDDRFWFEKNIENIDADQLEVSFEAYTFKIPAACVTDRSTIVAVISGNNGTTTLDDWKVINVERPKNSVDCSQFMATFTSSAGEKYRYKAGDTVTIIVTPVEESPDNHLDFTYNVVATKRAFVLDAVKYERVIK